MSVRHDWYQTDEKVTVTVLLKGAVEKNYKCEILESSVALTAENYELRLELLNPILPEKSSHKATPHKVEIVLFKRDFGRWATLERKIEEPPKPVAVKKKKPEDWDKLAKEVEKGEDKEEVSQYSFASSFDDDLCVSPGRSSRQRALPKDLRRRNRGTTPCHEQILPRIRRYRAEHQLGRSQKGKRRCQATRRL
jgi:hypothetical protein